MPPRRSATAAAASDSRCPTLLLVMEKGPLEGQICGFKPGTRVQIGRIVRGNSLAIKDAGVSSKHLLIQVEPASDGEAHTWTITDLGSSNGSFLNDAQLEPSQPAALSDGDVIKIGEHTSIKIKFEASEEEDSASFKNVKGHARRGRARGRGRGRDAVPALGIIDENSELGLGDDCEGNNANNLGPESTNENSDDLGDEGKKIGAVVKENLRARRTRGSAARESINVAEFELKMENVARASSRRTRSSNKEENFMSSTADLDDDNEKSDEMAEDEVKRGRKANRRVTRSSKSNLSMSEDLNSVGDKDLRPDELNGGQRVGVRRTRSTRRGEGEGEGEAGIDLSVLEDKRTMKGRGGRKKLIEEIPEEKEETNLKDKKCEEERESETGVERVKSGREGPEMVSTSVVKEGTTNASSKEVVVDLDKMTMEEWLDYLESFLPKQIIDETENMIAEMKQKAERLHEYMQQEKKH